MLMSSDTGPDSPFAEFADPSPRPSAADAYLARRSAERKRSGLHWLARALVFVVAVGVSVAVQTVGKWQGFSGLVDVSWRTLVDACIGGLAGAGLALVLLLLSAVSFRRRTAIHFETVNAWIATFPVILTVLWTIGVSIGALWPFAQTWL
jgi:hypothetical protein